jgi:hypothetical protein
MQSRRHAEVHSKGRLSFFESGQFLFTLHKFIESNYFKVVGPDDINQFHGLSMSLFHQSIAHEQRLDTYQYAVS